MDERPQAVLNEYLRVITQRDEAGQPFVIVGGHAVNYWADRYTARQPRLEAFRPFTSKDLDLLATDEQARFMAARCAEDGWRFVPSEDEESVMLGSLRRGDLLVEFMKPVHRSVFPPVEAEIAVGDSQLSIRVSHPIELLRSKMDLAVFIPQDGSSPEIAPRRDVAHVQILALVVPCFLEDAAAQYASPSECALALQGDIASLHSLVRYGPARRFEDRYPGMLNWSAMVPDHVKELPFSDLYRRCVNSINGSIPPAPQNP